MNNILEKLDKLNKEELKEIIKNLLEEINKDELTNTYNRRILKENLDYDVLAMCDIDNFKMINDIYGHDIGDIVLVYIAKRLKEMIRNTDLICRYGGDEFVIIFKNCSIEDVKERIENIKRSIVKDDLVVSITLSVGLTEYIPGKELKEAIIEADEALYESKNNGKNKVSIYKKT